MGVYPTKPSELLLGWHVGYVANTVAISRSRLHNTRPIAVQEEKCMPSAVTASLVTVEIPTYALGPDSPYLSFAWRRRQGHYPYSVRLDLSTEPRPVKHRVIVLENRYLRAEILPDMGGRLYRLYDKVAGQETFMVPPTVKYQNIALRGAWIAGGIEWNFGQTGHTEGYTKGSE